MPDAKRCLFDYKIYSCSNIFCAFKAHTHTYFYEILTRSTLALKWEYLCFASEDIYQGSVKFMKQCRKKINNHRFPSNTNVNHK